ncbi:MAG: TrbC family F-type conjugative pilus assembly protein [Nitrospirota bacterium]|mgnify:FL=1
MTSMQWYGSGLGLLLLGSVLLIHGEGRAADSGTPSTAVESAQTIKRYAEQLRRQRLAGQKVEQSGAITQPVGIKRREGLFYFVSWSIPEQELKTTFREAFYLGATVVFRGLINDDMPKTIARIKAVAVDLNKEAPHVVLDPVIFRQFGITAVPALAIAKDQHALIIEGSASLRQLLNHLRRANSDVAPLSDWADGKARSWEMGGPITTARPVMPAVVGLQKVPSDLTKYPIWERDLEEVFKERIRQTNMSPMKRELETKVKDRLKAGPGLTLPPVTESRTFSVDLTQRIDNDIPNHDGSAIVVKAGTQVNPLLYVSYRHRLVVIDGRDARQVAFAQEQVRQYGIDAVKVLLSDGDFESVARAVKDRVYWLQPEIIDRFKLQHVPSVVTQNGPVMKVEEVRL